MELQKLKKYADLLVRIGGNVQKSQPVVVVSDVANVEIARMVAECAYDAGAAEVSMQWTDELSSHMWYLRSEDQVFESYPDWMVRRSDYNDDRKAVYLHIVSPDPDLMKDVPPERMSKFMKATSVAQRRHQEMTMSNGVRWTVMAVPSKRWAMKVFPELTADEAMDKLWDAIMEASRMNQGDPVEAWHKHNANFKQQVDFMNGNDFAALRFKNSIGTDISVELPQGHIWAGGGEYAKDGLLFYPNIPTEEVFTAPKRSGVNGKLVASMPLSYRGQLIEDFEIEFKDGKAVAYKAGKNLDALKSIIENDEGAAYLGEVALVSNSSPISRMGIMFYNTLFDENAACHFALGKAYPMCIKDSEDMSEEELKAAGINDSLIHVDFMVGTSDMSIVGIKKDGTEVPVFVNGDFV